MKAKIIIYVFTLACTFAVSSSTLFGQTVTKPRLIVLTDICYMEPDDAQSLVRLLVYSNQFDIKGLIASTSEGNKSELFSGYIRKLIGEYAKIRSNLLKHESGFPKETELLASVKDGLPVYGMAGVGNGKDSEGSEWIIKKLKDKDNRPLWINLWGGSNVLAQALWKIKETRSEQEAKQLIAKLRVYAISDQDDSGAWIRKNFPDLFYIVSPGRYQDGTWAGIMSVIPGINNDVVSNFWIAENVQQGHGPLGAVYPNVVYGVEGDTPSFLYLINNGLNSPEHPNWGSWGGRYELSIPPYDPTIRWRIPIAQETRPIWTNTDDTYTPTKETQWGRSIDNDTIRIKSNKATVVRWREDFQNDFAARMDWCVKDYKNANHPPIVKLLTPQHITVKSGEIFNLDGTSCSDPDGDGLIYYWFYYKEAGDYSDVFRLFPPNSARVTAKAPVVDSEKTIHFILKVTDRGTPRLTRYARVLVTVKP
ncbi:MAG: hypothetical protein A2066_20275 [Bacteroidetes bacterium GWB2_41_8]|nr:MAG: hypothetical protein A2066_20275 [Bacteroidetes bacterium GWB2_41_8]